MGNLSSSVTVAGNLTKDPEVRSTNSGTNIVKVTVAANPRVFNKEKNEWEDGEAVFWEGKAFGKFADNIAASFHKGERVILSGNVVSESWNDKDSGLKRTKPVIMIDDIGLSVLWNPIAPASAPQQATEEAWNSGGFGDDTPF